jgi:L-iditol 2-dehydrogenase
MRGGLLDLKRLITHVFPLEKAADALHLCSDTRNGSIKVLVADEEDLVL